MFSLIKVVMYIIFSLFTQLTNAFNDFSAILTCVDQEDV